jgi:hypothetical protein
MIAMHNELALLVRITYSDSMQAHRNTRQAFDTAVELVKQNRPDLSEREARKVAAEALAVEPEADRAERSAEGHGQGRLRLRRGARARRQR